MTPIQMTLDEKLLKDVDRSVKKLRTTRSALIRESIQRYLIDIKAGQAEAKHRAGYRKHPVGRGEFDVWESEQRWGD